MNMQFLDGLPDVSFFAQATDKDGWDITGSDGCLYIRLKTLRGAKKRVKDAIWVNEVDHITIFDRMGRPRGSVNKKETALICTF